jgi:isopentenyl diphosphate isomerase/L-lactate dehydrogenase-like FMN-dependent dehydrogenase
MTADVARCQNVEDFERRARRALPRALFDYVRAGAFSELTARNNVSAFDRYSLRQTTLLDVSECTLHSTFLGRESAAPLMLAPAGLAGLLWPEGEIAAARAAHDAGIPYCLSTLSVASLEAVKTASSSHGLAFQLYVTRDRGQTELLVERAARAGYSSLFLTVDVPYLSKRECDLRNGLMGGSRLQLRRAASIAAHPRWLIRMLRGPAARLGNFPTLGRNIVEQSVAFARQLDPSVTWRDVDWLRRRWTGRLVLKGIMNPNDALRAVDAGVDAIVVSNHGGRQLDGAPASITALADIVAATRNRVEVLFDGGIRRGRHIAIALALGARACLIGRAYLYGLAAGGGPGVARVIQLMIEELRITCALMGITALDQLRRGELATPDPETLARASAELVC